MVVEHLILVEAQPITEGMRWLVWFFCSTLCFLFCSSPIRALVASGGGLAPCFCFLFCSSPICSSISLGGTRSLFLLFFSVFRCSSPICASIACVGVDFIAFYPIPFFLPSFPFIVARRLRGGGVGFLSNKQII